MLVYFLDVFFDYDICMYNLFMGLVPYAYVCTAYAYIINIVQLILSDKKYVAMGRHNKKIRWGIYTFILVIGIVQFTQFLFFMFDNGPCSYGGDIYRLLSPP
jgi:succinate-acetate transporter protein